MKNEMPELVYIDDHGLLGSNFYWHNYERHGLTKADLLSVGLTSDRVQVNKNLIEPLKIVDQEFQKRGYKLYVKEGYRSKELYEIVFKRRSEKYGEAVTRRLLNIVDMPHSRGIAVDVALWDPNLKTDIYLRDKNDGIEALFIDFYKNKDDEKSQNYQELQELVIRTMQKNGFRLAKKMEYFHFNYEPELPSNY